MDRVLQCHLRPYPHYTPPTSSFIWFANNIPPATFKILQYRPPIPLHRHIPDQLKAIKQTMVNVGDPKSLKQI